MPEDNDSAVPNHVAIVMDGNGRWAQERGDPRVQGHRQGVEAVRRAIKYCGEHGISVLTLFAFSSENWQRHRPGYDHRNAKPITRSKGRV